MKKLPGTLWLLLLPVKPGDPLRLKFTQAGGTISGERTALKPGEATNLEQYQGVYWSDELETQYTIAFKDGKLTADHLHHGQIAMNPIGPDRFSSPEWFIPEVIFLRDSSNRISGLTLGGGRVTAVRFTRKMSSGSVPTGH